MPAIGSTTGMIATIVAIAIAGRELGSISAIVAIESEREFNLNGNHSPAIVAIVTIGSYPRMHSKLFNTVEEMEEMEEMEEIIKYDCLCNKSSKVD